MKSYSGDMKKALIILGDQLFPQEFYREHKDKIVFMAEDYGLCTHFKYHKHKIIFFLSCMERYATELKKIGFEVRYHELDKKTSFTEKLQRFLNKEKITEVFIPEVQDKFFEKELSDFFSFHAIEVNILPTPMFLCSREEFDRYIRANYRPFMKNFYERERIRQNILVDEKKKPEGGHWSFDTENRKKAPPGEDYPALPEISQHEIVNKIKQKVDTVFADHPGESENFWLPTSRKEALESLQHFLKYRLEKFGVYEDAITTESPFLYHSVLSPLINNGLLTPGEIVDEVLSTYRSSEVPLNSVEGFIRQIIGWREFIRGIYQNFSESQEELNYFNHQRTLTSSWYEGTTGILPVDEVIKKVNQFGYCHHIERLMIISNVMLLSEIHPREVHKWFMEMFVDSADWVMGPNVYGMGQFSDGGLFATKPYISGSSYILKMSHYKKEPWCNVWDGLYWRFVHKHKDFFKSQGRMSVMVSQLEKMDSTRKKEIFALAEDFIQRNSRGGL